MPASLVIQPANRRGFRGTVNQHAEVNVMLPPSSWLPPWRCSTVYCCFRVRQRWDRYLFLHSRASWCGGDDGSVRRGGGISGGGGGANGRYDTVYVSPHSLVGLPQVPLTQSLSRACCKATLRWNLAPAGRESPTVPAISHGCHDNGQTLAHQFFIFGDERELRTPEQV